MAEAKMLLRRWRACGDGVGLIALAGASGRVPGTYLVAAAAACVQGCAPWLTAEGARLLRTVIGWTQDRQTVEQVTEACRLQIDPPAPRGDDNWLQAYASERGTGAVRALGMLVEDLCIPGSRVHPSERAVAVVGASVTATAVGTARAWEERPWPHNMQEEHTAATRWVMVGARQGGADHVTTHGIWAPIRVERLRRVGREAAARIRQIIPETMVA